MKFIKKIKKHIQEVLKIKITPHDVAWGFALGTLIALLPTFGFGIFIGLLLLLIFEKISKISMLLAFAVWNPFVLIPIYALSYRVGIYVTASTPLESYRIELLNQFFTIAKVFLIGNVIVTLVFSTISYFIVYYLYKNYLKKVLK